MKLPHNSVDILIGVSTLTELWGHSYLVHLHCGNISLFSIFFSLHEQKAQKPT